MKICNSCKKEKSLDCFWKDKLRNDGLQCSCKECMRLWRKNHRSKPENKDKVRKQGSAWRKNNKNSWSCYFPKEMECEVCSATVFFSSGIARNSVHFDHRKECSIKVSPTIWLVNHKFTEENLKIWESCDFGILCISCNILLPTKNRKDWLMRITRYINK